MTDENETTTEPEGDKDNSTSETNSSPVEEVTKNYEELKTANDKVEAELLRGEQLKAKIALGGKSVAGQPQLTEDEQLEEKAKKEGEEIANAFR